MKAVRNSSSEEQRRQAIAKGARRIKCEEKELMVRVSVGFRQKTNSFSKTT